MKRGLSRTLALIGLGLATCRRHTCSCADDSPRALLRPTPSWDQQLPGLNAFHRPVKLEQ